MTETQSNTFKFRFDETSSNWGKSQAYNRYFLQVQQDYFNNYLKTRGIVFLNHILTALGLKEISQGQLVGWTLAGTGYVDFLFETGEFGDGINLIFNTEGPVWEKLDELTV